ncbi:MFS transporter [Candidatus Gottesmanbacteria bacterium]|nr:MFS transporter [Candidatus Gottesmanbacteria bacterium]
MSSLISLLRKTNFRNLWFGQITSQIAVNMLAFVLILEIYQATRSNTAVSALSLAIGLPAIFVGILAGGIVDSVDKRLVLLWCNFLRIIIFALFLVFFSLPLLIIYILAGFFSIVTQFFIPAEAPSIPSFVRNDELLLANSLFSFGLYGATIFGFIISGPLLISFGPNIVYGLMIILMSLAFLFAYGLPPIRPRGMPKLSLSLSVFSSDLKEGMAFIFGNVRVGQSLLLMTFSQGLLATLAVLAPGFADATLKIPLTDVSLVVMGPAALGLVTGALWVGTTGKQYLKRILILIGILATGVTLLMLSFLVRAANGGGDGIEIAMLLLFILGFTNALISVPSSAVLQEATEGRLRGRVYGVLTSLTGGAAILPVMFSGIMADLFGITRTLLILGLGVLVFGVYRLLILNQTMRNARIG